MTEQVKIESPEGRAAKDCAEAARDLIQGWRGVEVAVAAFGQSQQSQAALAGLVRLLLHKGIISQTDLGDSMRWAYNERADQLRAQREKTAREIILAPPVTARGN